MRIGECGGRQPPRFLAVCCGRIYRQKGPDIRAKYRSRMHRSRMHRSRVRSRMRNGMQNQVRSGMHSSMWYRIREGDTEWKKLWLSGYSLTV